MCKSEQRKQRSMEENSPRHLNEDPRLNGDESCQNFWYGDGEHIMKTQRY